MMAQWWWPGLVGMTTLALVPVALWKLGLLHPDGGIPHKEWLPMTEEGRYA